MYIHKHRLDSYYRPNSVTGENKTYIQHVPKSPKTWFLMKLHNMFLH